MQAEASNVVNALRFEKAPKYSLLGELLPPSIILSCEPVSKVTLCKVEHPVKAVASMVSTFAGIFIVFNDVQPQNAPLRIHPPLE